MSENKRTNTRRADTEGREGAAQFVPFKTSLKDKIAIYLCKFGLLIASQHTRMAIMIMTCMKVAGPPMPIGVLRLEPEELDVEVKEEYLH